MALVLCFRFGLCGGRADVYKLFRNSIE